MNLVLKASIAAAGLFGLLDTALAGVTGPGQPVPEPGSLALVGAAVAALVFVTRKRK